MTGEQIILNYAWQQMLKRQEQERQILKRNHEEEREMFYRSNKSTFDTMPREGR